MNESKLVRKLQLKDQVKVWVPNAPEGFLDNLGPLPATMRLTTTQTAAKADAAIIFLQWQSELQEKIPMAQQSLVYDGLLWICYPKKSAKKESDLDRDILWEQMKTYQLEPVRQVAIDETWSALRFRPPEKITRKKD